MPALPPVELLPGMVFDEAGRKRPAKITATDFRRHFLSSFPKLRSTDYDDLIAEAIDTVYDMFTGVGTLWDLHRMKTWYEKTHACYRMLTAWYIADTYPALVSGVPVMGGMPLKRKKVDGVDLTFADAVGNGNKHYEDMLEILSGNPWGRKARFMIKSAAKRAMLRNRRIV